jgi:hypothetical protein
MRNELGQFIKGNTPWNAGTKGLCKSNITSFKKGHKWPHIIESKRKKKVIEKLTKKPNLEMTENLAYLLGLMKGDGFVSINKKSNAHIIGLSSVNKEISNNFSKALEKIGINSKIFEAYPYNGISKQKQYRAIACSKIFVKWYKELKVDNLELLLNTKEKITSFIKGFYEAEGTFYYGRIIHVAIENTDLELLVLIKKLLEKINFRFNLNGPYKTNSFNRNYNRFRLKTANKEQVFTFLNAIKPIVKGL